MCQIFIPFFFGNLKYFGSAHCFWRMQLKKLGSAWNKPHFTKIDGDAFPVAIRRMTWQELLSQKKKPLIYGILFCCFFFADTLDESKLLLLREIAVLTWEHPGKYKPWLCDRRAWWMHIIVPIINARQMAVFHPRQRKLMYLRPSKLLCCRDILPGG